MHSQFVVMRSVYELPTLIPFHISTERDPLTIEVTGLNAAIAGQAVNLTCTVTRGRNMSGTPDVQWLGPSGNVLLSGSDGIVVDDTATVSNSTFVRTLQFTPVRTSHGGLYTCQAMADSVNRRKAINLTVQSKCMYVHARHCLCRLILLVTQCMSIVPIVHVFKLSMTFFVVPLPNVTIVPDRAGLLYSGTSLNLTCSVQFSSVADTDISVNISWIGPNGEMLTSTIVAEDPPLAYNSTTTILLSSNDSGTYSCNATANPVPPMTSIVASETGMATQDLTVIGE